MERNSMLIVKNLNKHYSKFDLKKININLEEGAIMGFIGPNGAGKSTTIKSILNIIPFDIGEVLINGMNSKQKEVEVKQLIGYVGEEINLYNDVTAYEMYKFIKKLYLKWDDNLFKDLIQRFQLDIYKKIGQYSKGMSVKLALALALSHHPKLIILDEPTSGLDPIVRNDLLEILEETVKREKCSVLFSSHITEDIVKIADKVTYIYDGEIMLTDDKDNILNHYIEINYKEEIPEKFKSHIVFQNKSKNSAIINRQNISDANFVELKDVYCLNNIKTISLDEVLLFLDKGGKLND